MIETDNSNFDELAANYDEYRVGYSKQLYDYLEELGFNPSWHILDVGCGTGIATAPLFLKGYEVTGIDPSEAMLARARIRLQSGRFVQARAEELPFKDDEFDAAVCAQAIHWFDQPKAIAEMARVVKPGGRVAIWWKRLVVDEPMRTVRATAAAEVGVEPLADLMTGAFKAFYGHPFKERWLRVIPFTISSDAEKWIGYERSRRRALNAYGAKTDAYLDALERIIREKAEDKKFQVRYTQYLYVGEVG